MKETLIKAGRVCLAIFYSVGLYAAEPVKSQTINPLNYTLKVNLTENSCSNTITAFGVSTACRLQGGAAPNRLYFDFAPKDYISLCGLDREGFREFCIVGSGYTGGKENVHLFNGRFIGVPSDWGLIQYSQAPYDVAELEYGPGFAWVELYPELNLAGERLCVISLNLESSQAACHGVGRSARSAKIIGIHNPGKHYWVCLRAPKDEANRCYSSIFRTMSAGVLKIMDIDSESPPEYGAIRVKKGRVAGSLYSVDYLQ